MHLAIRFLYLLMLNEEKKKRGVHRFNNKMPLVNIFMFYVFTSCLLSVVVVFIQWVTCSLIVRCREISKLNRGDTFRAQASNVTIGSGGYEGEEEQDNKKSFGGGPPGDNLPEM